MSLVVLFTAEGEDLLQALWLDKLAVADGEYWRLWTVTLVHADLLHLFFNMYALYLAGPIVERWYGSLWFLILYLLCAAAGSVASFVFGGDVPAVGASGAIFGLFGVLLAANRLHHPVDRANRGLVSQLGFLVLLNLVFGFASGGQIDNAAHLGGLFAGLWLGAAIRPTGVPTMSAMWRRPGGATSAIGSGAAPTSAPVTEPPRFVPAVAVGAVVVVVLAGIFVGTAAREDGFAAGATAVVAACGDRRSRGRADAWVRDRLGPVFATLLGPLPRPPLAADATRGAILDAVVAAQVEAGLEPVTDGGWPLVPDDPVAAWRATAERTDRAVKAVVVGPYTRGRPVGWVRRGDSRRDPRTRCRRLSDRRGRRARRRRDRPRPLGAGALPGPPRPAARRAGRPGPEALRGTHLSLAITGGAADAAGAATILGPAYASLAVDLIAGPDNWRLVRSAPGDRGIVCGALSAAEGSDDGPETLLWAAAYAAGSAGRGPDRVGLATASSLAALSWPVAVAKLARLGEAVRLAGLPADERLAAIDPRAIDSRSAALGRYEPAGTRRSRRRPPG